MKENYKIKKKIRLIEFFSGIGCQYMALERLKNQGILDFEQYITSDWDFSSVKSYKYANKTTENVDYVILDNVKIEDLPYILADKISISSDGKSPMSLESIKRKGTKFQKEVYNDFRATNNIGSITNIHGKDLKIVDTDKYEYILTYSFPCQSLSKSGKKEGMTKGSGTRSGLLWEIERILNECDDLPQVLIMENVTQVHKGKNKDDFQDWVNYLSSKGYSSFYKDMNACGYGVPQNRDRTIMVSILGDYSFEFPKEIELTKTCNDLLEKNVVDDKYFAFNTQFQLHYGKDDCKNSNYKCTKLMNIISGDRYVNFDQSRRVYSSDGVSQTMTCRYDQGITGSYICYHGDNKKYNNTVYDKDMNIVENDYIVRKFTPREVGRLMGITDEKIDKIESVQSSAKMYKQFGNGIVVDILYHVFKQLCD